MTVSRLLRYAFIGVLLAMLALAVYVFFNQPRPMTDADLNATVEARRTQTAVAVTPDFEATVEERVRTTATPTPPPSPGDAVGIITGFFTGLWNTFGFGGIILQVLCCIILPGAVIIGILRDPPRR